MYIWTLAYLWNLFSWQSYSQGNLPCHISIIFCHPTQYIIASTHSWTHSHSCKWCLLSSTNHLYYIIIHHHKPSGISFHGYLTIKILSLFYFLLNKSWLSQECISPTSRSGRQLLLTSSGWDLGLLSGPLASSEKNKTLFCGSCHPAVKSWASPCHNTLQLPGYCFIYPRL